MKTRYATVKEIRMKGNGVNDYKCEDDEVYLEGIEGGIKTRSMVNGDKEEKERTRPALIEQNDKDAWAGIYWAQEEGEGEVSV
jgi:hypothetical protein